jgi:hypothetical protein
MVVTIDQKRSRRSEDRVAQLADELNSDPDIITALPFERTIGDELQGVLGNASSLSAVILAAVRADDWWIGVGIGGMERLRESARASSGEAFFRARIAVQRAKSVAWGVAVEGGPTWASELEAAIALLLLAVASRTDRGWEAAILKWRKRASDEEIGKSLGLSRQAVQQRLQAAHYYHEVAGRSLVSRLARLADSEALCPLGPVE